MTNEFTPASEPVAGMYVASVVRSVQPHLSVDCKAWRELKEECRYWLEADRSFLGGAVSEPVAHMYPSDLKRFQECETFATAFSVAVGSPDERSEPLYTAEALRLEREAGRRERDAEVADMQHLIDTQNNALKEGARTLQLLGERHDALKAEVKELVEALRRVATSMRWPDEGQAWCYSLDEDTHDTLHAVLAKHSSTT